MDQAIDIGEFMGSWTLQMGYPIVHVKLTGENTVQISQMKYKFPGEVETESPLGLVKILQCYFGDIVFGKICLFYLEWSADRLLLSVSNCNIMIKLQL